MPAKIHETAIVEEGAKLGEGTRVWHHAHVRGSAAIGKNCNIGKNVYVDSQVTIGDNCKVQNNVSVYHGVTIGDDVFVGPSMTFTNDLHPRAFSWDESHVGYTEVKKGASIGANATIVCGTKEKPRVLGEYCMVGAGAVVVDDVPANCLAVGNPAKLIGFVCKCGERLRRTAESGVESVLFKCAVCGTETRIDRLQFDKVSKA